MITLAFLLDHQVISRSDKNTVVAGSKNYVRARFILRTDDWARPITAIFGGYTQLLDDNNECTVPWEVLQQPGKVEVSAFCGDLHTANIAVVPVEKTGYKSGETPKDPTPDVYDQLAKMVQEAVDTANSVREDADAGDFDGEQGPAGPQGEPGLGVPSPTQSDAGKVPTVKADGSAYELAGPYAPLSAAIRPTASGNPVSITDSVEWPLQGLKVYGKSVQDGTPSPESPVPIVSAGADGSIETTITGTGKNLLTGRRYYGEYSRGCAYVRNETEVSLPYAPVAESDGICYTVPVKKGVTYTFSVTNPNANAELFLALYRTFEDTFETTNSISHLGDRSPVSITPSEDGTLVCLIAGTWTDGSTTIHECTASELLQLEVGSTATTYEAPHFQSITVATPNGLPGVPVDSGGNYTDAEGQQSACDVKDYGTGKYTQMVGHIESYNGENITTPYMSTTGQLSTGAEVYYVLDEPVVTDISADELTAYRALHTYDGATVVSTAEDVAGLEVKYLADGEKYVERIVSQKVPEAAAAHTMALLADGIREGVNGV